MQNEQRTLYFGGTILTMDRRTPKTEALLVEMGRVVALGTVEDLVEYAMGADLRDLRGATLMPAFVDGLPLSTRKGHGYGTRSIRYMTERLGGHCQFSAQEGLFILRVVL